MALKSGAPRYSCRDTHPLLLQTTHASPAELTLLLPPPPRYRRSRAGINVALMEGYLVSGILGFGVHRLLGDQDASGAAKKSPCFV